MAQIITRRATAASSVLLDDAHAYLDRGWSCIPVVSKNGTKKPAVKWKSFQSLLPTSADLKTWFAMPGINGVAVISGPVSAGLAVVDFDSIAAYDQWVDRNRTLALSLPCVRTGRGFHVWCISDLPKTLRIAGGEYRGAGISLAPRSIHHTGSTYEWLRPLPAGALPMVPHGIFTGAVVTETADAIGSAVSAFSAVSETTSPISAVSVTSADIEKVIQMTQPKQQGERNACIMRLARAVKLNLRIEDRKLQREIVRRWHTLALPLISTKHFDDSWSDFCHAYRSARHPLGFNAVDAVALNIDPDDLPEVAKNYDSMAARKLIAICAGLAKLHPHGRFFLSTHDAGARIGVKPMTVWRTLMMLVDDKVIERLESGNEYRANRYRWIADEDVNAAGPAQTTTEGTE